jgi:membrane protease YdiL (CAAX protease family)
MGEPDTPAEAEPAHRMAPAAIRQLLLCAAGCMFAGMAVWVLVLDPRPAGRPADWAGWRGRDVLLAVCATYGLRAMALAIWAVVLSELVARGRPEPAELTRNLGNFAWQILACLVAVWAFALAPYGLSVDALALGPTPPRWLLAGLAVGLAVGPGGLLAVDALSWWVGTPIRYEGRQLDQFDPRGERRPLGGAVGMLLVTILLGPCVEEVLFRGVVYPGLRAETGPWLAVPLSALVFGWFHYGYGSAPVVFSTVLGIAFALLVEGSGSLWPAIAGHTVANSKLIVVYARGVRPPAESPPG